MLAALSYLHSQSICHRDVKPANLLLSRDKKRLQLCDFGCAISITDNEKRMNNPYVCSRFYRAPELLLGSHYYDEKVDLWSAGCVSAEMISGSVLFAGESAMGQVLEIVYVLGPVTPEVLEAMNASLTCASGSLVEDNGALQLQARLVSTREERLEKRLTDFRVRNVDRRVLNVLNQTLKYIPKERLSAQELLNSM